MLHGGRKKSIAGGGRQSKGEKCASTCENRAGRVLLNAATEVCSFAPLHVAANRLRNYATVTVTVVFTNDPLWSVARMVIVAVPATPAVRVRRLWTMLVMTAVGLVLPTME